MFTASMINYDNTATIEQDGFTISLETEYDSDSGTPWDNEDGHGPVSDWTSRDKQPGELVLNNDRSSKRYYDYAEAVRIARRDEWGFLPGPLVTRCNSGGKYAAWIGRADGTNAQFTTAGHDDINAAIRAVDAAHRATFPSARAYAAAAAMADYKRLRAWCNDDWHYMGVVVTVSRNDIELGNASLWGIESDCGDEYIAETANDLLSDAMTDARATIAALTAE